MLLKFVTFIKIFRYCVFRLNIQNNMNMNENVFKEFLNEPSNELKNKIEEFIEFQINVCTQNKISNIF